MISEILNNNNLVDVDVEVDNWEEAVKYGVKLLESAGFADMEYADAIIEDTKKAGPYYVLAPGIALPHSKAEAGVKKIGISILLLKNPVKFNHEDNDPVDIIITLCATDRNTHLDMMTEIVQVLTQADSIDIIRACKTKEEVIKVFTQQ